MKTLIVILVACLLLTACSTKTVEDMRAVAVEGYEYYFITISDIGERQVLPENWIMCGIGDAIKIKGYVYGRGLWEVECWDK